MALVVGLTLMGTSPAEASRTYYVATEGSAPTSAPAPGTCEGGTKDEPWGEPYRGKDGFEIGPIEYAMRCLAPGHTLVIRGGTYTERVAPVIRPEGRGVPSDPVRVRAHRGERVVIRGSIRLDRPDQWHIEGLAITNDARPYGSGEYLVKIRGGTGWSFTGGEVWGTHPDSYAAFRVEPSSGGPAPTGWRITGNCIHGVTPANDPGQDHGLYIHTGPGGSGTIERNVIFNVANGQNIKLGTGAGKGADRTDGVVIRHNTLYGARQNVMVVGDSSDNTIERNLMGGVLGENWYPNIRGYSLTGKGNEVRSNAGFTGNSEGQMIFVGNEGSSPPSTQTFAASGNHFPVAPHFDGTAGCDGFYPTNSTYRGYGAYAPVSSGDPIERIAGIGRVETSVATSKATFPAGGADTVVIARADDYPDALAGGPLAAALDAPILLSGGKELHPEVAKEVDRLAAPHAVLLGGRAALSDQIRRDLEAKGLTVERVEGADRFATAGEVGERLARRSGTDTGNAYVVEGADPDPNRGWPDAVAVGSLAATQGRPILLTTTDTLPEATRQALSDLRVEDATVVGGTASVSDRVAEAIDEVADTVDRIAGVSRYHTSRLIADAAVKAGADPGRTWFATGSSFPDALTAGPAVAKDGGVLLLVPGNTTFLNAEVTGWLDRYDDSMGRLRLAGGPAAISHGVEDKVRYQLLFR